MLRGRGFSMRAISIAHIVCRKHVQKKAVQITFLEPARANRELGGGRDQGGSGPSQNYNPTPQEGGLLGGAHLLHSANRDKGQTCQIVVRGRGLAEHLAGREPLSRRVFLLQRTTTTLTLK